MIERLEVVAGPGTVIRFGFVVAWASASASASLVSFLTESARNLAGSSVGGDQLADHLTRVLTRRDPEPHVPFLTVGPGEGGWAALLHGPVQVWDGVAWTTVPPNPGWIRASLSPRPGLSASVSGSPAPSPSPDAVLDLEAGVVPGGGFILLPAASFPPAPGLIPTAAPVFAGGETMLLAPVTDSVPAGEGYGEPTTLPGPSAEVEAEHILTEVMTVAMAPETTGPATVRAEPDTAGEPPTEPESAVEPPTKPEPEPGSPPVTDAPGPVPTGAEPEPGSPPETESALVPPRPATAPPPPGVVDLHDPAVRARVVPYPPLPPGGDPPRPVPGAPVVAGVPCRRGHINRPGMLTCARCGQPIEAEGSYQVSGTRPALGCLISDRGSVLRLDSGYLAGSDPARDPTVRGRLARPLVLEGDEVAASHAEIRLHDWDVLVTDRASEGGTHVYPPGSSAWERLAPYQPRVIAPGTHIAFGQRVVTFVSPWILPSAPGATEPIGGPSASGA